MNPWRLATPRLQPTFERLFFRSTGFVCQQQFGSELFTSQPTAKLVRTDGSDTAVVVQGPIVTRRQFTARSLRLLKRQYPGIRLVLSTWSDTPRDVLQELSPLLDELVVSHKPPQPGPSNINLQIHSTREGLMRAQDPLLKFVLKSRTDIALLDDFWLDTMKLRLSSKPAELGSDVRNPLCVTALNSYFFRPYTVSDFIQFGLNSEVREFWQIDSDTRSSLPAAPSPLEWAQLQAAEARPCVARAQRHLGDLAWTMRESLDFILRNYRIIDSASVGLFWFKYDWYRNHRDINCLAKGNRIMWSEALEEVVRSNFDQLRFVDLDAMANRRFGEIGET